MRRAQVQEGVPVPFRELIAWLRLSPRLGQAFWRGLGQSQAPSALALRQGVLWYAASGSRDARHLIHTTCAPQRVVTAIEALVDEGLLTRATEANVIEHAILRRCDQRGKWR